MKLAQVELWHADGGGRAFDHVTVAADHGQLALVAAGGAVGGQPFAGGTEGTFFLVVARLGASQAGAHVSPVVLGP